MGLFGRKMAWVRSMGTSQRPVTPEQAVAQDFLTEVNDIAISTIGSASESEVPAELAALEISAVMAAEGAADVTEPELEPEPEPQPAQEQEQGQGQGQARGDVVVASPPSSPPVSPEKDDGGTAGKEPDPRAEMTLTQKILWEREHMQKPQAACTLTSLRTHSTKLDGRLVELKQITQGCVVSAKRPVTLSFRFGGLLRSSSHCCLVQPEWGRGGARQRAADQIEAARPQTAVSRGKGVVEGAEVSLAPSETAGRGTPGGECGGSGTSSQ